MIEERNNHKDIRGWGIDADPKNDPTYPMKTDSGDTGRRSDWVRPARQKPSQEILRSNERPNLSAAIGETIPPKGLSGSLRRYAFRFSESEYGHWLPLLLADRINVWEGIVDDLRKGIVPNIFAERGWKAEWKYNRASMTKRMIVASLGVGVLCGYLLWKRRKG